MRYESIVEIYHSHESAQVILCGRGRIIGYRGDFVGQRLHAVLSDGMSQEFDFLLAKLALAQADYEIVKVFYVFIHGAAGDEHVIHVHEKVIEVAQDLVHHPLKGLAGVLQGERHVKKLKRSKRCCNCRLCDILFRYWDLMICGWPLVSMVCRTACLGWSILKFDTVTVGNSANNLANGDGLALAANAGPVNWDLCLVRCSDVVLSSSGWTSCLFRRSTRTELCIRKSAPIRALFTSATRNFH